MSQETYDKIQELIQTLSVANMAIFYGLQHNNSIDVVMALNDQIEASRQIQELATVALQTTNTDELLEGVI